MTTNKLYPYSSWALGYPFLWLNWQRSLLTNWWDIWGKTTPTGLSWTKQAINAQEKLVYAFLEVEEKSIEKSLDVQKVFWDNYFEAFERQKKNFPQPKQDRPLETTAKLEEFPSSAKLEEFPTLAKQSN